MQKNGKPLLDDSTSRSGGDSTHSKVQLIERNAILARLLPDEIESLAAAARRAKFHRGDIIWDLGNQVQWFGLITTGFVKMVKTAGTGKDAVLEIMGPDQSFGCLGVIEGSGCPLSAQCVTDVELLQIPRTSFLEQYEANLSLQKELMRVSARRLFAKLDLMAKLTSGRVESRIASVLIVLIESYGKVQGDGMLINVPLTRQDLSDFTGVTLESAIRNMSAWQKQGIVRSDKSMITILDMNRIEELAHGE